MHEKDLRVNSTVLTASQDKRPTIGFLTPHIGGDGLGARVWSGVMKGAQEHDVNVICFVGGELRSHHEFQDQANVLYELANSDSLDGLLLWGSTLQNFIGPEEFQHFCARFAPIPLVELDGIPKTVKESYGYRGMFLAITHLIETHQCHRVAFIPGASGNTETHYRYQAYLNALQAHNIPFDPTLVAPSDYWDEASGRRAIRLLLDQRRVTFEAIAAANDRLAIGAIEALQEWGFRVPYDVAVVGFDNNPDGQYITPPLTTVPYPTTVMGQRAVKTLLHMIRSETCEEHVDIQAALVIRQSCGCANPAVTQAGLAQPESPSGIADTAQGVVAHKQAILTEMLRCLDDMSFREWAAYVLEAFLTELCQPSSPVFLSTVDDILGRIANVNGDVAAWQNVISAMRRQTLSVLADSETQFRTENLFGQARVLIGEVARRHKGFRQLHSKQQMNRLHKIGAELLSIFDVQKLLDTLTYQLPGLRIPACYLALYENPESPTGAVRLIMAYHEHGPIELPPGGLRFPSYEILPAQFFSRPKPYTMVAEALYHQDDQLGFIVFEVGPADGSVYAALRDMISSALQGSLLVQQVQTRSAELMRTNAELARQQYILDAFMENVPDAIYFKDADSRIIRANQAYARRMGLSESGEAIGKTDFDFFSHAEAQLRFEQEQEIIRSGQALIGMEEQRKRIEGHNSWSLTTKMPLRDEHGAIIGTFGISRDISKLKEAQASLERAYGEIFTLNTKLKEENARYYLKSSLLSASFESSDAGGFIVDRERWNAPLWCVVLFKLLYDCPEESSQPSAQSLMGALKKIYETQSRHSDFSGVFNQITDTEAALILNVANESEIYSCCSSMTSCIQAQIQTSATTLVAGIGKSVAVLEDLHHSYDTARQALLSRPNSGTIQILTQADAETRKHEALMFSFPAETERQLIAAVITGHAAKALQLLHEIVRQNALEQASYQKLTAVYHRCLRTAGKILAQHPLPKIDLRETALLEMFRTSTPETLSELSCRLEDIFQQITGWYEQHHQRRTDRLIHKLVRYLEQHYSNPMLSLQSMAEAFGLTPKYISEYFKTRTGTNYVEYLATLRISNAKKMLVEEPVQKIYHISEQVGFVNAETFIRTFKRLEGMTPGMYRKQSLSNT